MKPYDFKWTKFYEKNLDFLNSYSKIEIELSEEELLICSTIIDNSNYSILTTQKLITRENGIESIGSMKNASDGFYGDFKGYKNDEYTFGQIELKNGAELKYFIETGKGSMVMIYGVRTRIKLDNNSDEENDKVLENWKKRGKI